MSQAEFGPAASLLQLHRYNAGVVFPVLIVIPFPREEVGRSLATALASGEVSISHLLMHAGRRGVRDEVRPLLESTISGLRIPGSHSFNEHVEEVLKGVSSMTR